MTDHPCPLSAAEWLVIIATIDAHPSRAPGPARVAGKAKAHMDRYHPTTKETHDER